MERMLVVVFDNEKKAHQGKSALAELQREGGVTVYADAMIIKHADGTVTFKETNEAGPRGTLSGTAVGGLIGLLGGPVGLAVDALSGLTFGAFYDIDTARVGVDEVSKSLTPNKVALVAEVLPRLWHRQPSQGPSGCVPSSSDRAPLTSTTRTAWRSLGQAPREGAPRRLRRARGAGRRCSGRSSRSCTLL